MSYTRTSIRENLDDKGLINLVCTILRCIYGKAENGGGFGSGQGGHDASVLAIQPKLRILVMGLYYVLKITMVA
jgi:hypothetical protein